MKRLLPLLLVVIGAGALATGCNVTVTPRAASVNGTTISTASFNADLHTYDSTQAGQCLLQVESQGAVSGTTGTGGSGTFDMAFADRVLGTQVDDLLAEQLAASKGLTVTADDLANAQSEYESELDSAIAAVAQQESTPYCVSADGTAALTGAQVLGSLPESFRTEKVRSFAIYQKLLAHGANITDAQVEAYYNANKDQFTTNCLSGLSTDTEAHANQYLAELQAGANFADVAKANSLDTQTAANGGALGCNLSTAELERSLGVSSLTVGVPIGPLQDQTTGAYEIFEVTSQTVLPLATVESDIRQALYNSTDNSNRVATEVEAYARNSEVSVNPQYGTWKLSELVAPTPPPAKILLPSVSGQLEPSSSSLNLGNGTGTGSAGSSTSGG